MGDFLVHIVIKVTGGTGRGRKLRGPRGLKFRPTTGRVKEFIFSYLGDFILEAKVLDLFSGTGSLGIEALSRGAKEVVFVERSVDHIRILKRNILTCGFSGGNRIIKGDAFSVIPHLSRDQETFDLVFADPPFTDNLRSRIVETSGAYSILAPDGLLFIEHEQHDECHQSAPLQLIKTRKFGHCVVSIYE